MSSCLASAIFCASSRSTPASTTSLGHTRASGRNSLCLECPRLTVVSWHSLSSVACITTTGGWRDTHGVVWIEKVASTGGFAFPRCGTTPTARRRRVRRRVRNELLPAARACLPLYLYADDFLLVCTLKWLIARWTSLLLLHSGHSATRLSCSFMLI